MACDKRSETIIKSYRKMAMLSVKQMAQRMEMSEQTYRLLENGTSRTGKIVDIALKAIIGDVGSLHGSRQVHANYSRKAITEYREANPDATWDEIYKNVPNNYSSVQRMKKAYHAYRSNAGIAKRHSNTGYRGVYKKNSRYTAKFTNNGVQYHLGMFDDPRDAAEAYDTAAIEAHGMEAKTNRTMGLI